MLTHLPARFWLVARCGPALVVAAVAFVLACTPLSDYDLWWHVRAGEWILQHHRVPDLDPFSFGSPQQHWIDLHWLFQIGVALDFRIGGVAGTILLAATLAALAALLAVISNRRPTSWTVVLLIWIPALLLASSRFRPRPEMVTLVCLAGFLAVLSHVQTRPRFIWFLPIIQLLWVNTHGLFVLGPIVLALWWFDRLVRRWRANQVEERTGPSVSLGLASLAVITACWCNPYGHHGALFPLVLYPKVTQAGNPYKEYIDEFVSPQRVYWSPSNRLAQAPLLACFHFVLLLLPVSFIMPALCRAISIRSAATSSQAAVPRTGTGLLWLSAFVLLVLLLAVHVLGLLLGPFLPALMHLGKGVPVVVLLAGLGFALWLKKRSPRAAALAATGALGLMAEMYWLSNNLASVASNSHPATQALGILAVLTGMLAATFCWQGGASLFAMLLAAAFSFLAWQATNSLARFGLVAGVVLSWNLGPWVAQLAGGLQTLSWQRWLRWLPGAAATCLLAAWAVMAGTDHYLSWLKQLPPPGLGEYPLVFAHDAARFAGQKGMPQHALVYDLGQACVYLYHNAPANRPYMDARLEIPTRATFETYVRIDRLLDRAAPTWADAVHELGDPLLLLGHESSGAREASVLVHPHWRLVYCDALASVFLPRGDKSLERRFPTLDLGMRHFRKPLSPSVPSEPGAARAEAIALFNLGLALGRYPEANWRFRIPVLLSAHDRAGLALEQDQKTADMWLLLGQVYQSFGPDLHRRPPAPAAAWDPYRGMAWAQATYCYRKAQPLAPEDASRLLSQAMLARQIRSPLGSLSRLLSQLARGHVPPTNAILGLLNAHRLVEATRLAEHYERSGQTAWPWETADALAGAWMHLGYPERARHVWQMAQPPATEALRESRLASTFWVERDYPQAIAHFRRAEQADPTMAEPWWALAWLNAEQGRADEGLCACRTALKRSLPAAIRADLEGLAKLLCRYSSSGNSGAIVP